MTDCGHDVAVCNFDLPQAQMYNKSCDSKSNFGVADWSCAANLLLPGWQRWLVPSPRHHLRQRSTLALTAPVAHPDSWMKGNDPARHPDTSQGYTRCMKIK